MDEALMEGATSGVLVGALATITVSIIWIFAGNQVPPGSLEIVWLIVFVIEGIVLCGIFAKESTLPFVIGGFIASVTGGVGLGLGIIHGFVLTLIGIALDCILFYIILGIHMLILVGNGRLG